MNCDKKKPSRYREGFSRSPVHLHGDGRMWQRWQESNLLVAVLETEPRPALTNQQRSAGQGELNPREGNGAPA